MIEVNEKLVEARLDKHPAKLINLQSKLDRLPTQIYEPVKEIVEHYQEGITTEKELLQVKDYYFKKISCIQFAGN